MQVKNQQLELDMEQQAGSKLGKEYVKAVYCHPAYLMYMQKAATVDTGNLGELSKKTIILGYNFRQKEKNN